MMPHDRNMHRRFVGRGGMSWPRSLLRLVGFGVAMGCAGVKTDITAAGADPAAFGSGGSDVVGNRATGGAGPGDLGKAATGGRQSALLGAGGAAGGPACGLMTFNLTRKPADLFLVLDRSGSMRQDSMGRTANPPANPSKWDQVVPALTEVITQTSAVIPWGMKTFPENGASCAQNTVTTAIDVPVAPMNGAGMIAAIAATTPNGSGTPTGAAVDAAVTYLRGLTDGNPKFIVLATDGAPSCSGTVGSLGASTAKARTDAVTAVSAAALVGIHTFVVGVATTSANDSATLNNLAIAGLEPRQAPNSLGQSFYLASTRAELVTSLKAITGMISNCSFPLGAAPPDPSNIAVKVSAIRAPRDTTHNDGWDYTSAANLGVTVYGSWCDMIQTSAANMVQITYGCPLVSIP